MESVRERNERIRQERAETNREYAKRTAGVEPSLRSSLSGVPPAVPHDAMQTPWAQAWGAFDSHFKLCFFCHIGDRYTEDHFCEEGRDLIIAAFDEGPHP